MTAKRHDLALVAGVVAVAVILALGPSTAAAEPPAVGGAPSTGIAPMTQPPTTPSTVVLSNETTVTTWAHPVEEGADGIVWLAADAPQNLTGKFLQDRKVIPW